MSGRASGYLNPHHKFLVTPLISRGHLHIFDWGDENFRRASAWFDWGRRI